MTDELLPPGTAIDLDNCAREPIHVPGSVQPRGVLIVVREPELTVLQVSENIADLLGVAVPDALGAPLRTVLGADAASALDRAIASFSDLRERNPIDIDVVVDGAARAFDAILHREPDSLLFVELEPADGPRPFSFPNTYLAVRSAVGELNRAAGLDELFDSAARSVRALTGFDRVMVYRYDEEYNGEVVAEAKRDDLNPFLGLHYPATDIPAQARALYEKNWIRLISDVDYRPSPIVPSLNPVTGRPLDLTHSTLRSVSPIHIEYLQNMGVGSSMSISLLRDGTLWGLIACHHYSGPHAPPYGTRAAAEFLGTALSLRLVVRHDEERMREQTTAQAVLAKIGAALFDPRQTIASVLADVPGAMGLIPSDGVAVRAEHQLRTAGSVPDPEHFDAIATWAAESGDVLVQTDSLERSCPDVGVDHERHSGALVLPLPDGQYVAWFRAEERRSVDWGGDPHNKAIAVQEGDSVRLSPRKSFERWQEIVRNRSMPWTEAERAAAIALRGQVIDAMYQRARDELRLAERLQRSLLPQLPDIPDWRLSARYEPASGGRIGGDWYDAFPVSEDVVAVVLGDVAGNGLAAAGTMAQLRNVVRAFLFQGLGPADALTRLNDFACTMLPGVFATSVIACADLRTGEVRSVVAGHPTPYVVAGPSAAAVEPVPVPTSPPIGVRGGSYEERRFTLRPDDTLVLYSDGVIERRGEDLDVGLLRLAGVLSRTDATDADAIWAAVRDQLADDDVTILSLHRPG